MCYLTLIKLISANAYIIINRMGKVRSYGGLKHQYKQHQNDQPSSH